MRDVKAFRALVWKYYRTHGRHDLPWRKTKIPYRILVSEVMLQQTQVPRVIEKYKGFLKKFPTVRALAGASLADVLRVWSGLGYNRRAKYLHDTAKLLVQERRNIKYAVAHLKFPGVGEYTKAAVRVFAFNEPEVLLETNIRTAFIHHFFPRTQQVDDRQISTYAEKAAKNQDPREWHWALMDYGVHIKKLHKNPARRSASYTRQSRFEGSLRQVRGAILRELHTDRFTLKNLPFGADKVENALEALERDGLIVKEKGKWQIA